MRRGLLLLGGLALLAGLASWALAQEDLMTIKSDALKPHARPAVVFNHKGHADKLACVRCHHDYDANLNNNGGDGNKCGDCHGKTAGKDNPVALMDAFHRLCKDCHENFMVKTRPTGPLGCGECHQKGERPAKTPPAATKTDQKG